MIKSLQVGKFYLIDGDLYQLVQSLSYKLCMIEVKSGNRLKDPIHVPSDRGFLTKPIIDQHYIDQIIPSEYPWKEVTVTMMYQHTVTTVTTKTETLNL